MEKEVSLMTEIAMGLIALGVFIGIVFVTVNFGRDMQEQTVVASNDIKESLSISYLRSIASGEIDSEMPAATAYNIMTTYEDAIVEEASNYDDKIRVVSVDSSALKTRLKGRVMLEVHEVSSGTFVAFISMVDETVPQSYIDGKTNVAIATLKAKYGL